jgi:hypothetical protein
LRLTPDGHLSVKLEAKLSIIWFYPHFRLISIVLPIIYRGFYK